MKAVYRGFIILMLLLIVLGAAMMFQGAWQHTHRPIAPALPGGSARVLPEREWEKPNV